jgi:hypothetical protein
MESSTNTELNMCGLEIDMISETQFSQVIFL